MTTENESPVVLSVETTHPITAQDIGYILVGEFEGNPMASWVSKARPVAPEGKGLTPGQPWYDDQAFIASPDFAFTINYDDPDGDEEGDATGMKTIRHADIQLGLQTMAKDYPDHWADLINEDGNRADAITYDVAVQCIVLGSVIYG